MYAKNTLIRFADNYLYHPTGITSHEGTGHGVHVESFGDRIQSELFRACASVNPTPATCGMVKIPWGMNGRIIERFRSEKAFKAAISPLYRAEVSSIGSPITSPAAQMFGAEVFWEASHKDCPGRTGFHSSPVESEFFCIWGATNSKKQLLCKKCLYHSIDDNVNCDSCCSLLHAFDLHTSSDIDVLFPEIFSKEIGYFRSSSGMIRALRWRSVTFVPRWA